MCRCRMRSATLAILQALIGLGGLRTCDVRFLSAAAFEYKRNTPTLLLTSDARNFLLYFVLRRAVIHYQVYQKHLVLLLLLLLGTNSVVMFTNYVLRCCCCFLAKKVVCVAYLVPNTYLPLLLCGANIVTFASQTRTLLLLLCGIKYLLP